MCELPYEGIVSGHIPCEWRSETFHLHGIINGTACRVILVQEQLFGSFMITARILAKCWK